MNTEEDEEFNRIEREAAMRKAAVSAAVAKREWVGLTDEEIAKLEETTTCLANESWLRNLTRAIEAKLKEKNEM
jgi:hypothetical protein